MNRKDILKSVMTKLKDRGAEKISLSAWTISDEEFNLVYKELNLLRSVEKQGLSIAIIKDNKQARTQLNQLDEASLDSAIAEVMTAVESSNADPAFDISPAQEPCVFTDGPQTMETDKIVARLTEFSETMKRDFACVGYDATLTYHKISMLSMNSNGVDFERTLGVYQFNTMFTAKIGSKMSSFNYTGYNLADLDKPLMEINDTRELIRQITEQTETKPIPANFTGDVVLAPTVCEGLLSTLIRQQFGDGGLITNSSRFPDHLGQRILDEKLSVFNKPLDPRLAYKEPFTSDDFYAVDAPVIENGVLIHYPIGIYAANKTGKQRTIGNMSTFIVEAGDLSLKDMIANIGEGVLCMRASFGSPNAFGDLSAVLKNSYYIKDGKIQYPISETMMSANLVDMFNAIKGISREVYNDGSSIVPYMTIGNVDFSCK